MGSNRPPHAPIPCSPCGLWNQHYDRGAAGYSDQGKMELVAPADYAAFGLPSRLGWPGRTT